MEYADLIWDHDKTEYERFIENLAPIVLFTYNRLSHTRQTIEALRANVYAAESRLYIYSDGPKNESADKSVREVRDYLHSVTGFKEIHIVERARNWGLAENIIDGVTKIVNEYGKIIVVEDDIVTSKYFLKYMNDALEVYRENSKVMEISGYMYPIKKEKKTLSEAVFVKAGFCWGWGTWKDRWQYFDRNPRKFVESFSEKDIYDFEVEGSTGAWQQVVDNYSGALYTWAVFWDVAMFLKDGLTLVPRKCMSMNIGMDNTGTNCLKTDRYDVELCTEDEKFFPLEIKENTDVRECMKGFFLAMKPTLLRRIASKIYHCIMGH